MNKYVIVLIVPFVRNQVSRNQVAGERRVKGIIEGNEVEEIQTLVENYYRDLKKVTVKDFITTLKRYISKNNLDDQFEQIVHSEDSHIVSIKCTEKLMLILSEFKNVGIILSSNGLIS